MRRRTVGLVLLAAAVLVAIVVLLAPEPRRHVARSADPADAAALPSRAVTATARAATARPEASAGRAARLTVEGVVHLPAGAAARTVQVLAGEVVERGLHLDYVFASDVGADEPFVLDLPETLADAAAVHLRFEHRACFPEERVLEADAGRRLPPIEVRMHLAAVVTGRVHDVQEAGVRAFTLRDGVPAPEPVARVETFDRGRFVLRLPDGGTHVVVALAPGRRPAWAFVEAGRGQVVEAPDLAPQSGVVIAGRVLLPGGRPAAAAEVTALAAAEGRRLGDLLWTPAGVERATVRADADAEGRYRIDGLAAGAHAVWVSQLPAAHLTALFEAQLPRHVRDVSAPFDGADFELDVAELCLTADGEIWVSAGDGDWTSVLYVREACILVRPALRYSITVEKEGFESVELAIESGARGTRTTHVVELTPLAPPATLEVRIEGGGAWTFTLDPVTLAEPRVVQARATQDVFVLRDQPPGEYVLAARPAQESFLLDAEARVSLTAGKTTVITLRPARGGRLEVLARAPDGRTDTAVACLVRDADGNAVPLVFRKEDGRGGFTTATDRLPAHEGPARASPALPPGRYALEAGGVSAEFAIAVGETTRVELALPHSASGG